jgi:hypothetical protein
MELKTLNNIELLIQNDKTIFAPIVEENITWELNRKGSPGRLDFTIVNDGKINIQEGNPVRMKVNGKNAFYGFIFSKNRGKDKIIKVTAYDQLRYLKNKDTYVYSNKTATEVIKMIADDCNLNIGILEDTALKIQSRVEDNKTLFDIIQTALDLTLQTNKKMYVLYDDFGKLTLKNIESMKLNLLIDEETGEDFDYTSSIGGETYNKIKLAYNNEDTGKREIYIAQDSKNINNWGILQYFDTIEKGVNGIIKVNALLSLYNKKTRTLTIKNAFSDIRVRAGSAVVVVLNFDDVTIKNFMMVEKVKHTFDDNHQTMDLTLRGGEFIA